MQNISNYQNKRAACTVVKALLIACVTLILALTSCLLPVLANFTSVFADGEESDYRTVKASVFNFEGYHDKDESGRLSGYGIEFLNLVSKYSHLNFEYTGYETGWNWDTISQQLKDGKFDVVTSVTKNPAREADFDFSLPMGRKKTVLSIKSDETRFVRGNYNTYDKDGEEPMRVGHLNDSSLDTLDTFNWDNLNNSKKFEYTSIEYDNPIKLAEALQKGDIDAIVSSNLRKTTNEKELDILDENDFYAVVNKGETELLDEINRAIRQMDIDEGDWQNTLFYKYYGPNYSSELAFSDSEKAYINRLKSENKKITVTASGDRAPYSYVENGELKGIMPDYFAEVMELAGLSANYRLVTPDSDGVNVVLDSTGDDDIKENQPPKSCFKTNDYLTARMARVTRQDHQGNIVKVAVAKDSQFKELLEQEGYEVESDYSNEEAAMRAVQRREVDAACVYSYTAQWFINHDNTNSLYYNSVNGMSTSFSMHIEENTDRELVTILNKCIKQMSDDAFNQLASKYTSYTITIDGGNMSFGQYLKAHPEIIVAVCFIIVLIAGIFLVLWLRGQWNRKLLHTTEQSNKKMGEQLAIVEALSRDYTNVFAVNEDSGTARTIKLEGYVTEGIEKDSTKEYDYAVILAEYIRTRVHPEDKEELTAALSLDNVRNELKDDDEFLGSYRILENGETHHFQYTFLKIADNDQGHGDFILAGFRNIDEVIKKEQEQKDVLSEALAQAQYANKAKTTFLNNMSHDIRTPMNAIIGFTNLATTNLDNKELIRDYLGKIMTSGNHLLSLINDVLDMSRIESGKVKIEEKEVSLPEIMRDLKTIVQADVKAKQMEFNVETAVTNETVMCDKLRLNQVLLNIISNAIKYTKAGGAVSVRVTQTTEASDGYASYEFNVKDTGIGMSPEFLLHVFEPFEREQTATVSGIQGTGLGLAITKNIVDMMGGTITVDSEVGKGSEFSVKLCFRIAESPVESQQTNSADEADNAELNFEGKKLLLVEDNELNREIAQTILEVAGFAIDSVEDGSIAVEQMKKMPAGTYDCILMDVQMPIMNGYQATRAIRALEDPVKAATPIVAMTANAFDEDRKEALESGMNGYVPKPIDINKLMQTLKDILK